MSLSLLAISWASATFLGQVRDLELLQGLKNRTIDLLLLFSGKIQLRLPKRLKSHHCPFTGTIIVYAAIFQANIKILVDRNKIRRI